MRARRGPDRLTHMDTPPNTKSTTAFYAQAAISFGIALVSVLIGVLYLPVDTWIRAFLGLGTMYLVTSSFMLAKVIRDAQENTVLVHRLDQARVDKLLAEHDPFNQV